MKNPELERPKLWSMLLPCVVAQTAGLAMGNIEAGIMGALLGLVTWGLMFYGVQL